MSVFRNISRMTLIVAASFLTVMAAATPAHAIEFMTLFDATQASDYSEMMLRTVFTAAFNSDEDISALRNAIEVFNVTLLSVAGLFVSWQTILGMVNSAHEGKPFGKTYHSVWAPIRATFGVSLVAPIPGVGYCAAQILVMQVAMWGIGLANTVWAEYSSAIVRDGKTVSSMQIPATYHIAENVLEHEICAAILRASGIGGTVTTEERRETVYRWNYGDGCGSIRIDIPSEGRFARAKSVSTPEATDFQKTQSAAVTQLILNLRDVANEVVDNRGEASMRSVLEAQESTIESARSTYGVTLQQAAETILADSESTDKEALKEELAQNMEDYGWAAAGQWYLTIARMSGRSLAQFNSSPDFSEINPNMIPVDAGGRDIQEAVNEYRNAWREVFGNFDIMETGNPIAAQVNNAADNDASIIDDPITWLRNLGNGMVRGMVSWFAIVDDEQPLIELVEFGHKTIAAVEGAYIAMIGGFAILNAVKTNAEDPPGIAGWVKKLPFVGGAVGAIGNAIGGMVKSINQFVAPAIMGVTILIIVVGITHAYIIPMIPYIMMLFAVLGWLLFVAEAMIAAPIWGLMHARLDGQDFIDNVQKPGWVMAFNLFLRPALVIMALVLSFAVYSATIFLMNNTFMTAVTATISANWGGILGALVLLSMATYLHYQIAHRCFSLVHQLPDRISRWFGGENSKFGEDQDAQGSTTAIVGGVTRKTENLGRNSMLAGVSSGSSGPENPGSEGGGEGSSDSAQSDSAQSGQSGADNIADNPGGEDKQ